MPTADEFVAAIRERPLDDALCAAFHDWLEEQALHPDVVIHLRAGRMPLTGLDEVAVASLYSCTFLPGSWNKRFARDVYNVVVDRREVLAMAWLTPKQYACLWRLCWRYRRQIKNAAVLAEAERIHRAKAVSP